MEPISPLVLISIGLIIVGLIVCLVVITVVKISGAVQARRRRG